MTRAGSLAIVTGASNGIGCELARCCAEDGYELLIAADEPEIHRVAEEFRALGVPVEAVEVDLATPEGVDALCRAAAGRSVDALLANAGCRTSRAFLEQDFGDVRRVIDTNIAGTIDLTQRVGRGMRAHASGRILLAGPTPASSAVCNGAKAFIDSFARALRAELKYSGVSVTWLARQEKDDPASVARLGYKAMERGDGGVVSGWTNKLPSVANATLHPMLAEQQGRNKMDSANH